jgi:arsenical pump membrane protein
MDDIKMGLTLVIFTLTILFMIWKPRGLNETIPTFIGASLFLLLGIVPLPEVLDIFEMVSGPSITIISTIIMTVVLESIGFFKWIAKNIIYHANGSGIRLFIYINALCFMTTIFFNNDGSILITTPIIIHILTFLKFKDHQKIPYLLSGALIATASSAPIAVSNIANLIALKIVGLDLNSYIYMMFVPSMLGIIVIGILLYFYFKHDIPKNIPIARGSIELDGKKHPLSMKSSNPEVDWATLKIFLVIVVLVRAGYFALSPLGVPIEIISIIGASLIIFLRWVKHRKGIKDVIRSTPWHILLFAFSMYILVFGLHNAGITSYFIRILEPIIQASVFHAIFIMGTLLSILSNIVNNLPSVMIGTLMLTDMDISVETMQLSYLANVIGADIGSLLTPIGTLATLIWMYLLKEKHIKITWGAYFKVTLMVIPIGLIISLLSLYFWNLWLMN